MTGLSLFLLGPFQTLINGRSLTKFRTNRVQALLIYLAVESGFGMLHQQREALMDLLWPGLPLPSARQNLRQTLYELRKCIPTVAIAGKNSEWLHSDRQIIEVNPAYPLQTDTARFLQGITAAEASSRMAAIDLFRGDFLTDFYLPDTATFEEWAAARRGYFRRAVLNALSQQTDEALTSGDYTAAGQWARRQLMLDNLCEGAHRQLIQVLAATGRRSEAIRQYDACRVLLATELDLPPATETEALVAAIRANAAQPTALLETPREPAAQELLYELFLPSRPKHNLPHQPTSFVNRPEVTAVTDLLADPDVGLLTILGLGGMGKTRLGLAVAARQVALQGNENGRFPDGVYFVDLQDVDAVAEIAPAINQAIGFKPSANDRSPRQQLLDYLRRRQLLLVLDNFEQLLAGVDLLIKIRQAAPGVCLLITSRQKLAVQGEYLFPLPGLAYPAAHEPGAALSALLPSYPAYDLFIQRVKQVKPDFQSGEAETAFIWQICHLTNGMPLALELAAGWANLLSLPEIAAQIERGLDILESDLRDVVTRQRNIQTIFNTTWDQLNPAEQDCFARLCVFRGGFTYPAAQAVAGATLRQLALLTNHALLRHNPAAQHYHMHRLLRQFGKDKLNNHPDLATSVREKHSAYFTERLEQWGRELYGPRQAEAKLEMESDSQNIRLAWEWMVEKRRIGQLDKSVYPIFIFYHRSGRRRDIAPFCQPATDRLADASTPEEERVLAKMLFHQGFFQNDETGRRLAQQSMALINKLEAQGDEVRHEKAFALLRLADLTENVIASTDYLAASLALFRAVNDKWHVANLLFRQSIRYFWQGDLDQSDQLLHESHQLYDALGDEYGKIWVLSRQGLNAQSRGRFYDAQGLAQEAVAFYRQQGDLDSLGNALSWLANIKMLMGDFSEATALCQQAAIIKRELRLEPQLPDFDLDICAAVQGDYHQVYKYQSHLNDPETPARIKIAISGWLGAVFVAENRLGEAKKIMHDCLDSYQDTSMEYEMALFQIWLALIYQGLEKPKKAIAYLQQALRSTLETKIIYGVIYSLPAAARLFVATQPELAIEIYAAACQFGYVANSRIFADVVGNYIAASARTLPPGVVTAAQLRGQQADPWVVAQAILDRLTEITR